MVVIVQRFSVVVLSQIISIEIKKEYDLGDNTEVEIEVDMEKKGIFYFINKMQCPYYICGVSSSSLLFGISADYSNAVLKVLSVKKMEKSSAHPSLKCDGIKWKKEENKIK
jgi:hypothetical protein